MSLFLHTEYISSSNFLVLQEPAAVTDVRDNGKRKRTSTDTKKHFRIHFYNYGDWEVDETTGRLKPADIQKITVDYRKVLEMTPIFYNLQRFPRALQRYPSFVTTAAAPAAPERPVAAAAEVSGSRRLKLPATTGTKSGRTPTPPCRTPWPPAAGAGGC
jgi:hypothetical protein